MKISKLIAVAFLSVFLTTSCSKDDETIVQKALFEDGFFILNEGSASQGSISFLSNDLSSFTANAYTVANPNDLMGKFAQSIFFSGDNAYIIAGGSNKINVVNRFTLKLIAKIETGLKNPRYGVVKDGKAYVTNANTYSTDNPISGNTDDYIAVINLANNTIEATIPLNATADKLAINNEKIYIIESYNNSNVLVYNTVSNTLETPITIGSDANSLEINNGFLYILRAPYGIEGQLVKINLSSNLVSMINLPIAQADAKNLDIEGSKIYYTQEANVFVMDINATVAPTAKLFSYTSTSLYGKMYGFAVKNDRVYIADAGNFSDNGSAYIYSLTGMLLKEKLVGVGPNGFYFN